MDGFDLESDFLVSSLLDEDEDDLGERFDDFLDDPDEEEECFLCLEECFSVGGSRGTTRETRLIPLFCSCRSSSFIACNASSSEPLRSVSETQVEMSADSTSVVRDSPLSITALLLSLFVGVVCVCVVCLLQLVFFFSFFAELSDWAGCGFCVIGRRFLAVVFAAGLGKINGHSDVVLYLTLP